MLQISEKLTAILFDIDGVLTDGSITLDANGEEIKTFHVRDGQLIQFMRDKGFVFGAISGRDSAAARKRMKSLKIEFIRLGQGDKLKCYEEFKKEFKLKDEQIAFIGDDIIDIPVMQKVGISLCPADASDYVLDHVHHVCKKPGGRGVLREFIDAIIASRSWNIWSQERGAIGFRK